MVKMQANGICVSFSPSVNYLWDLLLWICLTFRQPKAGEICLSTCTIDANIVTLQELTVSAIPENTSCWYSLFDTAIVAMDPRIKCSSQAFLDIDFNMMLQIAAVEYPVMVDNGLILMGYSTALVPVEDFDHRTILWHLETAKHDFQFKTTEILATKKTWLKKTKLEDLQFRRALLDCRKQLVYWEHPTQAPLCDCLMQESNTLHGAGGEPICSLLQRPHHPFRLVDRLVLSLKEQSTH